MTRTTSRTPAVAPADPTSLTDYRARTRGGSPNVSALRGYFTGVALSDARDADFHRLVAGVLARAHRVDASDRREWHRFLHVLERHRTNPKAALNCGVLANLVGIAAFGDAADFVALDQLGSRLGRGRVAAVQHRAARFVEPDQTFPITTVALRRMVGGAHLDPAVALLLEGVDLDRFLPMIRTQAQLAGVVDGGSVLEWRHHLAVIAASPWSPYPRLLVGLAEKADRPQVGALVERFTAVCCEQSREREREQVAEAVRRVVSDSGVTQQEFARWVGTSPSRLSTYLSGSVTPSASLMLRMARTSRLLQEREVPQASSTVSEQGWGADRAAVDAGMPPGAADPTERLSRPLGRDRSHLSAV